MQNILRIEAAYPHIFENPSASVPATKRPTVPLGPLGMTCMHLRALGRPQYCPPSHDYGNLGVQQYQDGILISDTDVERNLPGPDFSRSEQPPQSQTSSRLSPTWS